MVETIQNVVNDIDGIELNKTYDESKNSYYAVVFKYNPSKFHGLPIDKFIEALHMEGGVEFDRPGSTCPVNRLELFNNPQVLYPNYQKITHDEYPNADKFYENTFKLPVWYTEDDLDIVLKYCDILRKVSSYYKNIKRKKEK